jgi:hypothetical protein
VWISQLLDEKLAELKTRLKEHTRDTETRLLRAFADYRMNASVRLEKLENDTSNLDASLTTRLGQLEKQVNDLTTRVMFLEARNR